MIMRDRTLAGRQIAELKRISQPCTVCPRRCLARTLDGEKGVCHTAYEPVVASSGLHHGEERCISGTRGSGTVFFAGCTMQCIYCQNFDISTAADPPATPPEELAELFLNLQNKGAHNINLVSPTHNAPAIAEAVIEARSRGLTVPIIYNTGGYDSHTTLKLLAGIVDIYLVDIKYGDDGPALSLSNATDYPFHAGHALHEMYRQVGDLARDEYGIARTGVLVRHLVLPGYPENSMAALTLCVEHVKGPVSINIMRQYRPVYRADEDPKLTRPVSSLEFHLVEDRARQLGFTLVE